MKNQEHSESGGCSYSPPQEPERGSSQWGYDDERGAANRMTPEKVLESMQLIKAGKIYQLGRMYEKGMPWQWELDIPVSPTSPPQGINNSTGFHEKLEIANIHVGTHMDALVHVGIGDSFYNGFDRREFYNTDGVTKLGIEQVGVFLTRGILLDIPRLKGKSALEKGYEITDSDLNHALQKQNLEIRPGDVVLIHTGWGSRWRDNDPEHGYLSGEPGLGVSAAHFLVQQQITLVGSDNWGIEVLPTKEPDAFNPVHQIFLTVNGIYLLENLNTTEMIRDSVYEFAFFFAPIPFKGATGSFGNPVAVC